MKKRDTRVEMDAAGVQAAVEADGQVAALEAAMAEFEAALLRYAVRLLHDTSAAQDVVQNVFIKLHGAWPAFGDDPARQLKSWLYRVTHNEAVDYIRRENRLRLLHARHAEETELAQGSDAVGRGLSDDEKKALVMKHLRRLHPREQQVVLLRMEEGMSYEEISRITGRSEGNVGNILHHAVRKLGARLREAGALDG